MRTILRLCVLLLGFSSFSASGDFAWEERQSTPLPGEFSFRDSDLTELSQRNARFAIYVWSPHMPLSVEGAQYFLSAAKALALPALLLLDPQADESLAESVAEAEGFPPEALRRLRSLALIRRDALLHFPSVLYVEAGEVKGSAVPGSRRLAYEEILRRKVSGEGNETKLSPLPEAISLGIKVRMSTELPARDFGYAIRPLWGTRWVALQNSRNEGFLFNLEDRRLVAAGYSSEFYVTPQDHRYAFFRGDEQGALGLAETSEFLLRAEDPAHSPALMLHDSEIGVFQQSLGTLSSGGNRSLYRMLTSSPAGPLLIRDYTIQHRRIDAPAQVAGKSKVVEVCANFGDFGFALPMLSKDGALLAVNTDFSGRFGVIYQINPRNPGSCTVKSSLDVSTGAMAFSFDGKSVAFSAGGGGVYVYEIGTKILQRLDGFEVLFGPGTPLYPEYREDGSLLVPYLKDGGGIVIVELEVIASPATTWL